LRSARANGSAMQISRNRVSNLTRVTLLRRTAIVGSVGKRLLLFPHFVSHDPCGVDRHLRTHRLPVWRNLNGANRFHVSSLCQLPPERYAERVSVPFGAGCSRRGQYLSLGFFAELALRTFWISAREFSPFQFGKARSRDEGDWIRKGSSPPLTGRRGRVLS
jgi:hypothetical protein